MRDLVATALVNPERIVVRRSGIEIGCAPECSYARVALATRDTEIPIELLGSSLSTAPGTCSGIDPVAWWVRPRTWLVAAHRYSPEALIEVIASAMSGRACAIVDVSDSLISMQIRGDLALELLSKGTGFDVRAPTFVPGRGTRIRFAHVAILLRPTAVNCFELVVDRSAAVWLADWLRSVVSNLS